MKKLHVITAIFITLFLVSCGKNSDIEDVQIPQALGETQSVWSEQSDIQNTMKETKSISRDQKLLFEISDILQKHGETYETLLSQILGKYNNTLSQEDIEKIKTLLSQNLSVNELKQAIFNQLSITILESDIEILKNATNTFIDEKNIQKERLSIKEDKQIFKLIEQRDILIQNIIQDIISSESTWTNIQKQEIITEILSYFYENRSLLEIESFTEIIQTLQKEYNVVITQTSIINNTYDFNELSFMDFMQSLTQAYETSLSYTEHIEEYLNYISTQNTTENIISEISMIEGDTPLIEYETLITENTQQVESLFETYEVLSTISIEETESYFKKELDYGAIEVLYQERVQETAILPDVMTQVLQQEYQDDSELIADMTPLSYIQKISGNILITNLAGGSKIGEENMLLYPGYTLESFGNSEITLVFSDESILRLEENSRVTLTQSSENNGGINIEYGNIWARVIKPLFTQDSFKIESESISLAVRGTSVYLQKTQNSQLTAYVVDSYVNKGTQSLKLTNSISGEDINLSAGEKYNSSDQTIAGQKTIFTRSSLMGQQPQVQSYLREDLKYLSLLIDDRARGFYNNPLSEKNDTKNFIEKISGELQASLPSETESSYFFDNTEVSTAGISNKNIYLRLVQDHLISKIKDNTGVNKESKIDAIAGVDLDTLQESVGNLREIENRLELNIQDDIISSPNLSSKQVIDVFVEFSLDERQAKVTQLTLAKKYLIKTLNNGSPYITEDLDLIDIYKDVSIDWDSNNTDYLQSDGKITQYSQEKDIIISLKATLSLGSLSTQHVFPIIIKKRALTDAQELEKSYNELLKYIANIDTFTNTILLPDFNEKGAIIPKIIWTQDTYINSNGSINRPSFPQGNKKNHTAIATLSFGDITLEGKEFLLKEIVKQPKIPVPIPQLLADEMLVLSQETLSIFFSSQKTIVNTVNNMKDLSIFSEIPGPIKLKWEFSPNYIAANGSISHPSYNTGDKIKTGRIILSHPDTATTKIVQNIELKINKQACDGTSTLIDGTCYELVANAEYNENYKLGSLQPTNTINRPGFVTVSGQKGVEPLSSKGDYLSYDLSTLNLGSDWAIEMSVRGEDLKRSGTNTYYLFASPSNDGGNFAINSEFQKLRMIYLDGVSPNETLTSAISNNYQKIIFTPNYHFINTPSQKIYNNLQLKLANSIKVGSSTSDKFQWNSLINYMKIYKKN